MFGDVWAVDARRTPDRRGASSSVGVTGMIRGGGLGFTDDSPAMDAILAVKPLLGLVGVWVTDELLAWLVVCVFWTRNVRGGRGNVEIGDATDLETTATPSASRSAAA